MRRPLTAAECSQREHLPPLHRDLPETAKSSNRSVVADLLMEDTVIENFEPCLASAEAVQSKASESNVNTSMSS
jgi:hypothetical protein